MRSTTPFDPLAAGDREGKEYMADFGRARGGVIGGPGSVLCRLLLGEVTVGLECGFCWLVNRDWSVFCFPMSSEDGWRAGRLRL